jgi:hypothetical protein
LQENHNNSSTISQSSSNNHVIAETQHQVTAQARTSIIDQTLQSININNNNNGDSKNKIHSNVVDQQIREPSCKEDEDVDEEVLVEPNNNTNNNNNSSTIKNNSNNTNNQHYSSSRACYRHHPVSRRGTEFISQQVPSFRTFGSGAGSNNKYSTQRKG